MYKVFLAVLVSVASCRAQYFPGWAMMPPPPPAPFVAPHLPVYPPYGIPGGAGSSTAATAAGAGMGNAASSATSATAAGDGGYLGYGVEIFNSYPSFYNPAPVYGGIISTGTGTAAATTSATADGSGVASTASAAAAGAGSAGGLDVGIPAVMPPPVWSSPLPGYYGAYYNALPGGITTSMASGFPAAPYLASY